MAVKRDRQTLVDVARMYYVENLGQDAIAKKLGVSKSSISRTLTAAKEAGIIRVTVDGDTEIGRDSGLELALKKTFDLEAAYVAAPPAGVEPLTAVTKIAAGLFAERSHHASRIGFGWGITVQRMIDTIPQLRLSAHQLLTPLVGGMATVDTAPSGNNMIVTLAEKSGTRSQRFDAPAVVESSLTWKALMNESTVKASLDSARSTELAFVGIGTRGYHTSKLVVEAMKLSPEEYAEFEGQEPVGDMCGHYFDAAGTPLGPPSSHRVIGISIDDLRAIPTVIAIAAGEERAPGVLGALATHAVDILCVDRDLAQRLLHTHLAQRNAGSTTFNEEGNSENSNCPLCGK